MATRRERRDFRKQSRLGAMQQRLERMAGEGLWEGGARPRRYARVASRYSRLYDKLKKRDPSLVEGFSPFDFESGGFADPQSGVGAGPTTGEDDRLGFDQPETGYVSDNPDKVDEITSDPFGPDFENIINQIVQGFPQGVDINSKQGARTLETLFPFVQHAYNTQMQQEAVGSAAKSVDEYKNDPLLQAVSAGMADKLANPYTFDDETVQLMRNRISDDMANQEAAMGERLRSLGANVGMDPSSPRYASLAQQAALMRDINQSNLQRNLDIEMARQAQQDEYRSLGAAGQFAGAYQSGLGSRYAGLAGTQLGGKFQNVGNPFSGLWQGLMMEDELNKEPSFMDEYGGMIGAGIGAAGTALAPTPTSNIANYYR